MNLRKVTPGALVNRLGTAAVAESLRLERSTVWRWSQDPPKGTGGVVPSRYHLDLLSLSQHMGAPLSADDLVFGRHK